MKHFSTFVSMFLLLLMGGVQTATAQDDSDWEKYAQDPQDLVGQYVYLYNVTQHAFLNAGGNYGMNSIMNERGIRLTLERDSEGDYNLRGPIINTAQGAYLGYVEENGVYPVYVDRANADDTNSEKRNNNAKIDFVSTGTGSHTYRIRNQQGSGLLTTTRYWNYDGNRHAVYAERTNQRNSDVWCLISIDDYRRLTQDIARVGNYNVSGLLYNTRFIRNVSDVNNLFWQTSDEIDYETSDYCTSIAPEIGTNKETDGYAGEYGAFGCLEMGHVTGEFYQVVDGLQPGLYEVSAQAFFHGDDRWPYTNGAYGTDNTATASNAVIFANDAHIKGIDHELKLWGDHAIAGTKGAEVIPELAPTEKDYIVPKRRYSGFFHTDLDLLLRELGITTVVMTGLHAHMCVRHTSADAYMLGYKVVVATDCTDSFTKEDYEYGIKYLKDVYGAELYTADELIAQF